MEFEKAKANMDSFKESMKDADEKIRGFAESLGEIRSMFFQREQSIKTMEDKIDKMADVVESVEPSKLAEQRAKQEKDRSVMEAKLERLDKVTSDLLNRFAEIRETLEGIKNLKAIVDMSRDVGKKLMKIEEIGTKMDQMSTKLENTYLEMNKHLSDFPIIKTKVESMERSTRDMMKMIDETKMSLEKVPSVDDVKKLAAPEIAEPAAPVVTGDIEGLKNKRDELKQLLKTLEKEYKDSAISKESYKESSEKSKEKLKEIEDKIDALESVSKEGKGFAGKLKSIFSRKKEAPSPEGEVPAEEAPAETSTPEVTPAIPAEEGVLTQSMEVVPEEKTPTEEAKEAVVGKIREKEIEQVVQPKPEPPKPSAKKKKKTGLKKKIEVKKEEKEKKEVEDMSTSDKRKELLEKLKMR
jgi:hypothetical protein